MSSVTVIFTCFNRKEKTIRCLKSLVQSNNLIRFNFIVVDDNSSDGTVEAIESMNLTNCIILHGDGNLYWSGGMRRGIEYYIDNYKTDYVMFINDDVEFFDNAIDKILKQAVENDAVIVGATCNDKCELTYGARKLGKPRIVYLMNHVRPEDGTIQCDTFNGNCVLLKDEVIRTVGNFDYAYRHSISDTDYGLMVSKNGYKIFSSNEYVGICLRNSIIGSWRDTSLSRIERLKQKESIKGEPFKPWFYFLNKHFGIFFALRYSISPYLRILLGK